MEDTNTPYHEYQQPIRAFCGPDHDFVLDPPGKSSRSITTNRGVLTRTRVREEADQEDLTYEVFSSCGVCGCICMKLK